MLQGLECGGGSILILVLVNFMAVPQHVAQATNLIFFIPTAIIAIFVHIKNQNIDKEVSKRLFFTTVLGSGIGAFLTTFIVSENLKKYFGFFLLAVGIYEIITTFKEHKKEKKEEIKK